LEFFIVITLIFIVLDGCSNKNSNNYDSIPDVFTFEAQTEVDINTVVISNAIIVTGINIATSISISSLSDGTYSINGGSYTDSEGIVYNGDTITVKLTSSSYYNASSPTTLNIGGVEQPFNVITKSDDSEIDTTPDVFLFSEQTGVDINTAIISNQITVSGINNAAAISIFGADATYSINGGSYTNEVRAVANGDRVRVKVTSSSSYNTALSVFLNIEDVIGSFIVTTEKASDKFEWKSIGPQGGPIFSLVIDPTNNQNIYVGTAKGVFNSTNGGSDWNIMNSGIPFDYPILSLAIDPTNNQILYAGTDDGVFKTTNGGSTWFAINYGLPVFSDIISLVVDPINTQVIYAKKRDELYKMYKTTNGGNSWQLAYNTDKSVLAIDPTDPQIVYAVKFDVVYKTTNGGITWSQINNGLPVMPIIAIVIDPTDTQIIYVGNGHDVYKTTNGGETWSISYIGDSSINSLAIDPIDPQTVYVGVYQKGLYKTTNGGDTWSAINTGLLSDKFTSDNIDIITLVIDPTNSQIVYAGANIGGLSKTTNGGNTWSAINSKLPGIFSTGIRIDPSDSQTIYANCYKTTNGGDTWDQQTSCSLITYDPTNNQIGYDVRDDSVYKTEDHGNTWNAINTGMANSPRIRTLVIDPKNSQILYTCTKLNGIYKSTNGGGYWSNINSGLTDNCVLSFVIDPNNSEIVFAGTERWGLFKSINGGTTWNVINSEPLGKYEILTIKFDPINSQIVYVGTSSNGMYKTTNGGDTWSRCRLPSYYSINVIRIDPVDSLKIYVGAATDGVRLTTDGGNTWQNINAGLPTDRYSVLSIVIDPNNNQNVYASISNNGIYKMHTY